MPLERPEARVEHHASPAGGRKAVRQAVLTFFEQGIPGRLGASFLNANLPGGFDCPGCAAPDKRDGRGIDSCEQGQKAISREMTRQLADAAFFAAHPLATLRNRTDAELEGAGRLAEPLLYDVRSDTYRPVDWETAFGLIGRTLHALDPAAVAFYASGRSSNEAAFLWQLLARAYGSANLADSSNLCHEPSGHAMKEQIGMGKGTCSLEDFDLADCIIDIGHNPASNHPRIAGKLHEAARRGAKVIAVNPLKERGFTDFSDPKDLGEMLRNRGREVAEVYQVSIGGDLALMKGIMKVLFEREDAGETVLDHAFIAAHCDHYPALAADIRAESWDRIVSRSGLSRAQIGALAAVYAASRSVIIMWCMGITHHEDAVATIQSILNLLLLRGNIGRPGAGAVPMRGHSNVQGDRTMGCTFKVPPLWLDNIEGCFPGLKVSRETGLDAVGVIDGLLDGSVQAFLGLGGNFVAASPDSWRLAEAFSRSRLTVHIATKFNRTHCYPGETGLVLPCLGRTDIDIRAGREQFVSAEDSMSIVHSSRGIRRPASAAMLSEPAICAGLGQAVVGSAHVDWAGLADDYDRIRDAIEVCQRGVFHGFDDYNRRIREPEGFWLTNWAAQRIWKTPSGRAQLMVHPIRTDGPVERAREREGDTVLALMTIRSHDQFNTTVYGPDDRYRDIYGGRHVLFANAADIARLGFADGDHVDIRACSEDGVLREVCGFRLVAYAIPPGCTAAYFPEASPLAALGWHSRHTRTPASKEIPVRLFPARLARAGGGQQAPLAAPVP